MPPDAGASTTTAVLGIGHPGPALEERMVAVDEHAEDRANVERLCGRVGRRRPDVADGGEVAAVQHMDVCRDIRSIGSLVGA